MRPPIHRRAACLLASALAGTALAWAPSPAVAAQCPDPAGSCIVVSVVETVDGRTTVVDSQTFGPTELKTLADQDLPLQERQYALRKNPASQGGQIDTRPIAQGSRVSINALLADVDPALPHSATYLEMPNAAGVPAVLSDADLVDPATSADYPFFDKLEPAVFITDSGRVGYIRPLRDVNEDTNASDYFQVSGRLDITVHTTGTLLAPKVLSSKGTKLTTKDKTTFWATDAAGPGTAITSIVWDFGDGSTESTTVERPAKSYAEPGTYLVVVTVRTTDGSYGRSPATEITVDQAPPPPKAPEGGTGDGDGKSGDGKSGDGGSGGGSGRGGGSGGGDSGGGSGGGDSGGGGGGSGSGSVPPVDDLPGFDFEDPDFSSPDFEEPPVELDDEPPPAPVDDGLAPVEGYALSGDEIPGTPEAIPGTQTSTAPAPASSEPLRTRVTTWAVAAAAAALLIGVGAVSETRWFQDRLRHLRRRT